MEVQKHCVKLLQSHKAVQHLVGKQTKEGEPWEMVQWKALLFPYGKSSNPFIVQISHDIRSS